jgi:hypothetical protein
VSCETIITVSAEKVNAVALLNAEKREVLTFFGIYRHKKTDITLVVHPSFTVSG